MWRFLKAIISPVYRLFFRFRVTGLENIPAEGGVILCANHISNHDALVIGVATKRPISYLAKQELFKYKIFNGFLNSLKIIPVDRDKPSMDMLKRVTKELKSGGVIGIFMQGRRARKSLSEPDMTDYKAGVVLFAIKGEAPVVPIYLQSRYLPFSKVHIRIGKPISFEEMYGKRVRTPELEPLATQIMKAIEELM